MDEIIQESPHRFQERDRQNWILTGRSTLPGPIYRVIYFEFWKHLEINFYSIYHGVLCDS